MKNNSCFANGKLLITGEYLVLDGAKALAVPLKYGQTLTVKNSDNDRLEWIAKSPAGTWFKTILKLPSLEVIETSNSLFSDSLILLLKKAKELSDNFQKNLRASSVVTKLDFDPDFGFGSSSTLIYCVAKWAKINPYSLQKETFGGSGFDIACADAKGPITFQRINDSIQVKSVEISPEITRSLYFVYLGKKQQTSKSIREFRKNASFNTSDIETITKITNEVNGAASIQDFEALLKEHEKLMSGILKTPTIKSSCFKNYNGCVKSLGAWGGDFVLVTNPRSKDELVKQMKDLGFQTIYSYSELVLSS